MAVKLGLSIKAVFAAATFSAALVVWMLVGVSATRAAVAPEVTVGQADFSAGTLELAVPTTPDVALVRFDGRSGAVTETVPSADGTATITYRLASDTCVRASALDVAGSVLWESAPVTLSISTYRPGAAALVLPKGKAVGPTPVFSGRGDPRTRSVALYSGNRLLWRGALEPVMNTIFTLPRLSLPYGRAQLSIVASNGFGSTRGPTAVAYNLGTIPAYARYVLVDKSDMQLYVIRDRVVKLVYPIAIGMPGAPTPTGTFVLGGPRRMSAWGPWGVLRLPLLRTTSWGLRQSSYWIHGTNDPDSIGTMASNGCVRLYNRDVVAFERATGRERVVIRN